MEKKGLKKENMFSFWACVGSAIVIVLVPIKLMCFVSQTDLWNIMFLQTLNVVAVMCLMIHAYYLGVNKNA